MYAYLCFVHHMLLQMPKVFAGTYLAVSHYLNLDSSHITDVQCGYIPS